ncbi:OmpA family protein [Brevundimonas sp.]|uniref:OmpA family protein n=1 Tax=Brevundimonas sp. TaxID=1871086 RepID=UPI0025C57E4D|nr:OmpA family protein [Brevundimonas sp.]
MRVRRIGAALAASAVLAACGGGEGGDGPGGDLGAQVIHPSGVVLQVLSVEVGRDATQVSVRIINGRDRSVNLISGDESSYLLTDSGEKLLIIPPATNERLSIPAGQTLDGVLAVAGAPPRGGDVVLVLNERGSSDNIHSEAPRMEVRLPLGGAFGARTVAEVSALTNMRAVPRSVLRPFTGEGSSLGAGGRSASELRVVEALKTELGAVETERGTVVSLEGDVTFDFDRATIRPEARNTLERLAELLAGVDDAEIRIEGHTDSRGTADYNQSLSERRAEAVADFLGERGVSRDRLSTEGFGATRPVAPDAAPDDEAGHQRNRRVEVIVPGGTAAQPPRATDGQSRLDPVS